MSIRIELRRSPIIEIAFEGITTDEDFRAHLDALTKLIEQLDANVLVYDSRHAIAPSPRQRQMQADWMRTHETTIRRNTVGTAFVISSPLVRGALTAILWLQPLATDHKVVATPEEAFAWAEERLRQRTPRLRMHG